MLSLSLTSPARNFLIIFCVVDVACFDKMSPVCPGLAANSVIFPPVRVSRPRLGTAPQYGSHGPPEPAKKTAYTVSALYEGRDGIDGSYATPSSTNPL